MAEPVTKKIDTLPAMEEPVATNDKLLFLDVSAPVATMTKLITMNQVRISSAAQLDANVVENAKIKDGAVTSSKLATGAVTAGKIAAGGVSASSQFAAQVVDAAAIKDANITTAKLGNLQVTSSKLATGAVTAGKIAAGGVSASSQFAAGVVDTNAIKDANVTNDKIANATITDAKLASIDKTLLVRLLANDEVTALRTWTNEFLWPPSLNGLVIKEAYATLSVASSSGSVVVTVKNAGNIVTTLTVSQGSLYSPAGSINTSYRAITQFYGCSIQITSAGTGAKGLSIILVVGRA